MEATMKKVLLCEPNVSEGQDQVIVEQILSPIQATPGVKVVDHSADPTHNRAVFTYMGDPEAVLEATQRMTVRALELIDMRHHQGAHPRMGAVDVVPFVPVRGIQLQEAIDIARRYGKFVATQGVPVYYYERAATRPERESLPDIRRGEYEGLPDKLKQPEWEPDEGPATFNPKTGATVTGVRFPLVAFNVNLWTEDLSIAERIARAVRHISGGYRYVRAIGLDLEGKHQVQVSMNLVNYTKTPIHRVLETVRSEAERYGVSVAGTELIGPLPLDALEEVVRHYLQSHDFSTSQILETALID
jgi:glutamate formiminotransferase